MPITEALKKLIKTITGKNAVGETIEELVANLNDNYPEGGGGEADIMLVTATLDTETMEISDASATLAQVLEAAASGRQIAFQFRATAENEGTTIRTFDTFTDSSIIDYGNGTGLAVFNAVSLDEGTPKLCRICAASGDFGGAWRYDETELAGNAGDDYKVTVTAAIDEQTQQATITVDKSVKEIYEAHVSNKHCWANIVINGIITTYQRMELMEAGAALGTYGVTFGGVQYDDGAAKPVVLRGENTNFGEKESDVWIAD